jgi:hypothetical protein
MIPEAAVEAAAWGIYQETFPGHSATSLEQVGGPIREECLRKARAVLEAAAPHLMEQAWLLGYAAGEIDGAYGENGHESPNKRNPYRQDHP